MTNLDPLSLTICLLLAIANIPGELFGFENYRFLLGLTNVVVSAVSMCQGPLVEWAQLAQRGYLGPNLALLVLTLPLFAVVYGTKGKPTVKGGGPLPNNEATALLAGSSSPAVNQGRSRALSDAGF